MRKDIKEAMKTTVLYLTVLGCACAVPSGNYHQEYNYKTSSSSYRNNELQHQTDDQGYYRKDGDLEGRVRPKVDANSEHSEYVNPSLRNGDYRTGLIGAPNGDLSSYGHMRANIGAYNTNDQTSEGLAHSDHISGSRGAYSGYSSGAYGASYGSGSQSYSVASNLGTMTSRVQQELEEDLQRAIQENRAYSQNNQLEYSDLERELRANLTNKLNDEIAHRYGQQSIRGGLSYTISGGRLHSTANYDNQELLDLRRTMENSLLNQLRTRYNQVSSSSSNRYTYSTTTLRPAYYTHYPTSYRPITTYTTIRPQYIDNANYNTHYAAASNAESITTIAARVQNQLDTRLNQILDDVQRTHFSSGSSYSLTNTDVLLERLRNELRSNVTYFLEEEIRRVYGSQIQRDGHMYTAGSDRSTYSVSDLENLRSQIERNLIEKLNRDFERYRTSWSQQYRQSSSYNSQNSYGEYTTPRYAIYTTTPTPRYNYNTPVPQYNIYDADVEPLSNRPSSNQLTSLITGTKGGSSHSNHYLVSGSGQSGYEVGGSRGINQLQRQLQQDLSRQLQSAISRGQYGYYTSSGSYNPQSYQASLQQLQEELNRNLTRQLQEYSSGGYYSSYGNFDQAQLASLRNQLQADLSRQLQQGLQQSYHSSSSYSASSSSSSSSGNYRPTRGFENIPLGQYRSGGNIALMQGEDCVGDDPNAYTNHRTKRSYQPYRSQPIGLSYNYNSNRNYNSYRNRPQEQAELGQEIDNTDLTQQVEEPGYGKLQVGLQNQQQVDLGQQVDDSDLTQQVESEDLRLDPQAGQQPIDERPVDNDDDLTQQVVDDGFGKLQLGSQQSQPQTEYGQQVDDSDLTQKIDNADLTQQIQDDRFGKLQLGSQQGQSQTGHSHGQEVDDSDLTQQVESVDSQTQQQTGDDLTQQIQDDRFGKLNVGSQQNRQLPGHRRGSHRLESDSTRQVESADLHSASPTQQQERAVDSDDLTQQTEEGFGKLHLDSQQSQQIGYGQQEDNSDLTQQVEDTDFGPLQSGSQQRPQHIDSSSRYPQRPQSGIYHDLSQQQVDQTGDGHLQFGSQIQPTYRGDQTITGQELQVAQQIKEKLSKQLKNAIQDISYSRDNVQIESLYRYLNYQLRRNITEDIRAITTGAQYREFDKQQLLKLQRKLQNDLQLELETELKNISRKRTTENLEQQTPTDLSQQVDDSDLTQQTEDDAFGRKPGFAPEGNLNSLGSSQLVLNSNQEKFLQQIEKKLSEQISNEVKTKYSQGYSTISSNPQVAYQELLNALRRNISNEFHRISTSIVSDREAFNTYYTFTSQQLVSLKQQIENDLKAQLQKDMSYSSYNNQQLGQEVIGADLTQQVENSDLTQQSVRPQTSGQQPMPLNVLGQQTGDNTASETQDLNKPTAQLPHFDQVTSDSSPLTQETLDLNQRVDNNYHIPLQIPSANLVSNRRPVISKPIDSNKFIETEINQQQQEYPINGNEQIYENPHHLPTLNQVIQQNQAHNNRYTTEPPSKVEPLDDEYEDLTQQVNRDQQINGDLSSSGQQNPDIVVTDVNKPQPGGQAIGVTSQGQIFTETQSLSDAERDADVLIQKLREHNRNNPQQSNIYHQPVYSVGPNAYPAGNFQPSPSQQVISPNQPQPSLYVVDFNQQQIRLAEDLKYTLSKDLENAISEYYYAISQSSSPMNQYNPQLQRQLAEDLEKNITVKLQQLADGAAQNLLGTSYYIYGTLTQDQREFLKNRLQAELTRQLEQNLQSHGLQQASIQENRRYSSTHLYGHRQNPTYIPYSQRVNYGQPGQVEQNLETTSDLKPLDYQQANTVQLVKPNNNIGVKGRRYHPHRELSPPSQPISVLPPVPPQEPAVIPVEPVIPPEPVIPQTEDITETPAGSANATNENLPWWKRFGHKVKQGAQNLIG